MRSLKTFILATLILFTSIICNSQDDTGNTVQTKTEKEHLVQATLWFQQSAEMRAIYYQTFNLAKMVLDNTLMTVRLSKPAALIVDIDETMLDNSPFETEAIRTGKNYTKEGWFEWTAMEKAQPLPGTVDFMKYTMSKGVEVYYISNRYHEELGSTINNLKKFDFPNADSAHVFLRKDKSDKTDRRSKVEENHVIIMLMGDNLTDFSADFGDRDDDLGFDAVDEQRADFGARFFILPNPMYGEWEKAIYNNNYGLPNEEKDIKRKERLKGYED